jgi:hypothetical protein
MQVTFNNRLGSRSLSHLNILVAPVGDQVVIFEFAGQSIPGVAQIISTRSEKNGKWSFTEWTIELADGIQSFVWSQDWETSQYINAGTWSQAVEDIRKISSTPNLDAPAIERFIRARLPKTAAKLNSALGSLSVDPGPALLDLIAAQEELAAARAAEQDLKTEIRNLEEAEAARREASATRERVATAKAAMAKGASLADLKALFS